MGRHTLGVTRIWWENPTAVFTVYRYQQRDEIVNVQAMIESTHVRWLDQEKEYMQEQRLFYQSTIYKC